MLLQGLVSPPKLSGVVLSHSFDLCNLFPHLLSAHLASSFFTCNASGSCLGYRAFIAVVFEMPWKCVAEGFLVTAFSSVFGFKVSSGCQRVSDKRCRFTRRPVLSSSSAVDIRCVSAISSPSLLFVVMVHNPL